MGNIRNTRTTRAVAFVAIAVGLAVSACGGSSDSASQPTTTGTTSAAANTSTGADLQSLTPTPTKTAQTKGPDNISDDGIHMHYQVNGSPKDVMEAYKSALEAKGWQVTTIVTSAGGGGGGATYTGTNGDAYGVFDGGGFDATTYVDVCTWPTKPANPNCTRGDR